jgi:hypothetical protein
LVPLYAVVVLVAAAAMLLLVQLGGTAVRRARARTAADAAALAGAAEGRPAAEQVAAANGATLDRFDALGDDVEVRVHIGSTHAVARARREGGCRQRGQPDRVHFATCLPISPG